MVGLPEMADNVTEAGLGGGETLARHLGGRTNLPRLAAATAESAGRLPPGPAFDVVNATLRPRGLGN
jgi:hypothetical protein